MQARAVCIRVYDAIMKRKFGARRGACSPLLLVCVARYNLSVDAHQVLHFSVALNHTLTGCELSTSTSSSDYPYCAVGTRVVGTYAVCAY